MEVRVVMQDSTNYTVYGTSYEIFINGTSADSGNIRFANNSRYMVFDTAPNTGPAQYDNFSLETLDAGPPVTGRIPMVGLSESAPAEISGVSKVRLHWSTQPGRVFRPLISADLVTWQPLTGGNGNPLEIDSLHHTIQWLEAEIPESYRGKGFIRLEPVR